MRYREGNDLRSRCQHSTGLLDGHRLVGRRGTYFDVRGYWSNRARQLLIDGGG
jgi:hypothetical protein